MYPSGEITVLPRETACQIAFDSRLFSKTNPSTIQRIIDLLSGSDDTKFIKINRDICLIDEGREEDILPFENVEEFETRVKLRKAFECLTKPGTRIKSLKEYCRDVKFLKIHFIRQKLTPLYHRKLTLACLAVLYRRIEYVLDDCNEDRSDSVSNELRVYILIWLRLLNKPAPLHEIFRKSKNILSQKYDFRKCYDGKKYLKFYG